MNDVKSIYKQDFKFRKGVSIVQIHVAATTADRDQVGDEKPMIVLKK